MAQHRTVDGDTIDAICKAYYGTEDMVEQVYEANPRLARRGPVLQKGLIIELPAIPARPVRPTIRLWSMSPPVTVDAAARPYNLNAEFAAVVRVAPGITGLPTIEGNAVVGQTLTMVSAPVTGNPAPTPLRQWVIGGSNANGETALTYVVQLADVGLTIRASQIETNSQGAASALSEPTQAVLHIAPATSGSLADVTITVGDTSLIATAGGFTFAGTGLYSLTTAPTGATINSDTGAVDLSGVAVGGPYTLFVQLADAASVSRSVQQGFSATITAALVAPGNTTNIVVVPDGFDVLSLASRTPLIITAVPDGFDTVLET